MVFSGCSIGSASYDDAVAIPAPTFAPLPASPAESPQLEAVVLRDVDGLVASGPLPNPDHVARAFAALESEFPGTDEISDLYFDDENVWMTIRDPGSRSRTRSVLWSERGLSVGEPRFEEDDDDPMYPIESVRIDAIAALIEGLADRYPTLLIGDPRLSSSLSYDLGLSWRLDLVDARGTLAIIFADLDGTVTVVDQEYD